jgi:hypothetical protein
VDRFDHLRSRRDDPVARDRSMPERCRCRCRCRTYTSTDTTMGGYLLNQAAAVSQTGASRLEAILAQACAIAAMAPGDPGPSPTADVTGRRTPRHDQVRANPEELRRSGRVSPREGSRVFGSADRRCPARFQGRRRFGSTRSQHRGQLLRLLGPRDALPECLHSRRGRVRDGPARGVATRRRAWRRRRLVVVRKRLSSRFYSGKNHPPAKQSP